MITPPKLVYVTQAQLPSRRASAVHAMLQCEAFAELGFDTLLFGQKSHELPHIEDCHAFYGVARSFGVELRRRRRRFGITFALQARRIVRQRRADILYSRDLLAVVLAAGLGQPTVFEAHSPLRRAIDCLLFRALLYHSNVLRVVVISERLRELMLERYHPYLEEKRLLVAHDGVDFERLSLVGTTADPALPRSEHSFVLGYFGHLYRGRGVDLLLRIAAELPEVTLFGHLVHLAFEVLARDSHRAAADSNRVIAEHPRTDPRIQHESYVPPIRR